jgi:HEAT repeat protein
VVAVLIVAAPPNVASLQANDDVGGLLEALTYEADSEIRSGAAVALGELGAEEAVVPLTAALSDEAPEVRESAAVALGKLGDGEAVLPLMAAVRDDSVGVRVAAATALGRLADERGVDALLTALDDSEAPVRAAADASARLLLDSLPREVSLRLLASTANDDRESSRLLAANMLGQFSETPLVQSLMHLRLDSKEPVRTAAEASWEHLSATLDEAEFVSQLVVGLEDPDARVRVLVISDLAALDGDRVTDVLVDALADRVATVRRAAASVLGTFGDAQFVRPLLVASGDSDSAVQAAAETALASVVDRIRPSIAIQALVPILDDENESIRLSARSALDGVVIEIGDGAIEILASAGASDALLAEVLDVPVSDLAGALRLRDIQLEFLTAIQRALKPALDGAGVAGTASYAQSDAFHPTVLLEEALSFLGPEAQNRWAPPALRFVELTVDVETTWETLEVCPYTFDGQEASPITRYRQITVINVRSARSGLLVAQPSFGGPVPRDCEESEPVSITELRGDAPDPAGAVEWLDAFIKPPEGG